MNRMQSELSTATIGRRRANPEALAAKRQARRRQLIDATIDCISRKGIVDTTVPDIARSADMAVGSITQYFDGKDALFTATLAHMSTEFEAAWRADIAAVPENDAAARLRAFLISYFRPDLCQRRKVSVWFAFWSEVRARPKYRAVCAAADAVHDVTLRDLCAAVIAEGGYAGLDATRCAKTLAALSQGLWLELLTGTDGLSREELATHVLLGLTSLFPRHAAHFAA
ncbi:TetR family transcriptional regulator C-terminal domain-containing protein [Dongia sp.]|uniref:TetR family transcriptional regulator C-terminal domain-containing protein n=1 Tax=Dongia sp. TaxID=1977262 RepID=UPI0035AF7CF8